MLYTKSQLDSGEINVNTSDLKIQLSDYTKKIDSVDKIDYENLKITVANKMDKNSTHTHSISDISQLQQQLDNKLSNQTTYSYKTIINDIDKIDYITSPKVDSIKIGDYTIISDSNSLQILDKNNVNIFDNNLSSEIETIQSTLTKLNDSITSINAVLDNHKEAIESLMSETK